MLKNKETGFFLFLLFFLFICTLLFGYYMHLKIDTRYKKEFVNQSDELISTLIKNHPELEEEIISSLLSANKSEKNEQIMKKYGLDNIENLNHYNQYNKLKNRVFIDIIFSIIVLFFILTIFIVIFLVRQWRQVKSLSDYMDKVVNGNYDLNIKGYEEGTFSTLRNDVYKLMVKLKEGRDQSIQDKKELEQVLSDISHQIKTPLTSMYVINDVLKKDDIEPELKQQFLEKNKLQLERMEWLVSSLLKLSRLDSGSVLLKKEQVPLLDCLNQALEPLQIPMELKNVKVSIMGENITVIADFHWTVEVFINILKNAYEHVSSNGKIEIEVISNPIYTEVSISDNGSGIKKEDLPHIFERFYTGSNNKESIGIGLNMAKKIMDKQFGDIMVTSEEKKGTTFLIKFYKTVL